MRRIALSLIAFSLVQAQTPPAFDVASIKKDPWPGNSNHVGVGVRGSTLAADHTCLDGLVEFAYKLKGDHLSGGPSWSHCGRLDLSELYQVIAKAPADPPPSTDQVRQMLQTLLADRFQLKVHHEPKELPIFNLVVGPRGSKMKESAADAKTSLNIDARVNGGKSLRMTATHVSIAQLLGYFEGYAKRPLSDHTGLSGFYDFVLEWDADTGADSGPEPIGQTFAGALERTLGLKLEPSTGQFDTVVIDHAEKPTEN